jgi:acetylornithine/succinyldiaminopimelate/putrescine aminotransferase
VEKTFADRVFFCNSGAEANEGALKLARKYFRTVKNEERPDVICALGSFHGRTLATLKATGQPERWGPFEPLPQGFVHVPFNDLEALEGAVTDRTCAILLEPIQGEVGVKPASPEYLLGARRLCDRKGILLILDEVQSGMGRTGALFAHQHYGITPDIMSTAKGLANGLPIGAVLATDQVSSAFGPGDHGTTFGGGPVPCAAALATMEVLTKGGLIHNAASAGENLRQRLRELQARLPVVTEVRGLGLMLAIQLEAPVAERVALDCLERGLVINDIGLHILRFLPPLLISQEQIDELITVLEELLEGAHAG